jgi:hypothetical protein
VEKYPKRSLKIGRLPDKTNAKSQTVGRRSEKVVLRHSKSPCSCKPDKIKICYREKS